jgi:sn-glycerol 3-phosphate transport system ATP-binding protein
VRGAVSAIALRGLRKSFGRTEVIHGVDLEIAPHEFVVILGPSGCGKSTLLRMIAGLEEITAGEISIDGKIVNQLEPRERGCAMVFQNYALYPHMSVSENIGYGLKVAGVAKAERRARVAAVAKTLGIEAVLDRSPAQLSGGQRQRVAMGRAMIREPKVFLFDEPLSNLDAKLRVQMRVEIRKLHNRLAATSVFVTHDQVEAMTLADRLVVMNAGRIEQVGTPAEIYRAPATTFVAGFIGSPPMNLLQACVTGPRTLAIGAAPLTVRRHGLANGGAVIAGARPEEVGVGADYELAVSFVEELGAARLYHGTFEGAEFIVQRPSQPGIGRPVRLGFSLAPEAVHLFDAASGRRVVSAGDNHENEHPRSPLAQLSKT